MKVKELLSAQVNEATQEKNFRVEDSDQDTYGGVQVEFKGQLPKDVRAAFSKHDVDSYSFYEDGFATVTIGNDVVTKVKKILKDLGYTQVKTW